MSLAVIKDSHIKFMGTNYFVGNAQKVSIGDYGEKATPVFGQNKLEVSAHIPARKLNGKVQVAGPFEIDTVQSSKSNFDTAVSGSLKVIGASVSQSQIYDELESKHLKLVQLFVDEEPMKKAANESPVVLENLDRYGGDARIAHEQFVVMEASFASSFAGATNWTVSADALGIISVTASGGSTVSGKNKVTLSPGTGLAYLLLSLDWKKGAIDDTDVDEWSVN